MRERIEQQNEELSALRREKSELASTVRQYQARDTFREVGLEAKHADLFIKAQPEGDITVEAVTEFAQQYDLVPGTVPETNGAEEATPETTADPGAGLEAFSRGGSRAGSDAAASVPTDTLTKEQWRDLQRENPAAAADALRRGKVLLNKDNPFVRSGQYGG